MGFITLLLSEAEGLLVQISDSTLTHKRLCDVIALSCGRRLGGLRAPFTLQYVDADGDWVSVKTDDDVPEVFTCARAVSPSPLQV